MQPDPEVGQSDHWLRTATQEEKLRHVLKTTDSLSPRLREIFELTSVTDVKEDLHYFRDLELDSLPSGRVVLVGDAAHAMSPFRGEGGYQTFIDGLKLSRHLIKLDKEGNAHDMEAVKAAVSEYNREMLKRGWEAVRASRGTHKELMGKAKVVSLLLAWVPFLLSLLLRFAIKGPLKLKPLPEERIMLPGEEQMGEKQKVEMGFWERCVSAILLFLGLGGIISEKYKQI
ncbi:hypothetical protein N7539_000661 [Penicillium diatomitis]|uniref:FAD-binding domain-containing protein n=1 Tax=Penicillium diatomitis TaxID=2819901 RepID=A0A9W9XN46_9EURO|nr:uncharacterized protein N7539_000661 [Penicillium diatomitis]KAJ5495545.1 hypothetical protein N7539_000661 [Penicillium diatomitis]